MISTLSLPALHAAGVDFWLGNGHKWLYSPKGSCVLWVAPAYRDWTSHRGVVPNIISGLGEFTSEFAETGTKDYTAYLAMRDALAFRASIGGDAAIMQWIRALAWDGGQVLSRAFGNTPTMASKEMTSALIDVQLPRWAAPAKAANLTAALMARHNAFAVVYGPYVLPDGTDLGYWTRVSAQVYLDLSSFEQLAAWMLELLQ
jgi:selenocysteine lyase/cysteine desulfurase